MIEIDVVLSPAEDLPEMDIWLVVDLLRATTNIVHYFHMGGKILIPVDSVEKAREIKKINGDEWLLMGEREAVPPPGFDMGNSPLEYSRNILKERPFGVITTTNGTNALLKARHTGVPVYAACARNASASLERALSGGERIGILCAGRHGRAAVDDAICCGLFVDILRKKQAAIKMSDGAVMALELWESCFGNLRRAVEQASHYSMMQDLGMEKDVDFCCEIDRTEVVPGLSSWEDYPAFMNY
jgi:2-phosphosulfolactate phosphatase